MQAKIGGCSSVLLPSVVQVCRVNFFCLAHSALIKETVSVLTNEPTRASAWVIESSRPPNFEAHGANAGTDCLRSQILPAEASLKGKASFWGDGWMHVRDEPCLSWSLMIVCATAVVLFQGRISLFPCGCREYYGCMRLAVERAGDRPVRPPLARPPPLFSPVLRRVTGRALARHGGRSTSCHFFFLFQPFWVSRGFRGELHVSWGGWISCWVMQKPS